MSSQKFLIVLMISIVGAAILSTGCAQPKILTKQSFTGDRSVKYMVRRMAPEGFQVKDDDAQDLFSYYIRVCTLSEGGQESNCNDTLVLDNVFPQSLYR